MQVIVTTSVGSRNETGPSIKAGIEAGGTRPECVAGEEKRVSNLRGVEDPDGHVFQITNCEEQS